MGRSTQRIPSAQNLRLCLSLSAAAVVLTFFVFNVFPNYWVSSGSSRIQLFCEDSPVSELEPWNFRKKIIAFSLFVSSDEVDKIDFPWFLSGVIHNAREARLYYPEWIVRVYATGLSVADESSMLREGNVEIIRCSSESPLTSSTSRKMLTRFLVFDDPKVAVSIFRDTDSRLNPRELFAVNSWLSSDEGFHVMRDHPAHDVPVLGGMFGMKRGVLGDAQMVSIIQTALLENPEGIEGVRGEDQSFLLKYIWDRVKDSCLAHDIDQKRCLRYGSKRCETFPIGPRSDLLNFFVGAAFKSDTSLQASYNCSVSCSPILKPF